MEPTHSTWQPSSDSKGGCSVCHPTSTPLAGVSHSRTLCFPPDSHDMAGCTQHGRFAFDSTQKAEQVFTQDFIIPELVKVGHKSRHAFNRHCRFNLKTRFGQFVAAVRRIMKIG